MLCPSKELDKCRLKLGARTGWHWVAAVAPSRAVCLTLLVNDQFPPQLGEILNHQGFYPLILNEGVLKCPFKFQGLILEGREGFLKTSSQSRRRVRIHNGCARLLRRNKQLSIFQVSVFAVWGNRGSLCCQVRGNSNPLRCFGGEGTGGSFLQDKLFPPGQWLHCEGASLYRRDSGSISQGRLQHSTQRECRPR